MPTDYLVELKYENGKVKLRAYQENGKLMDKPSSDLGRLVLETTEKLFGEFRKKGIREPRFILSAGTSQ